MDPQNDNTDDFQRWYYGGAPPAGDCEDDAVEPAVACGERLTASLLSRLFAARPLPTP